MVLILESGAGAIYILALNKSLSLKITIKIQIII